MTGSFIQDPLTGIRANVAGDGRLLVDGVVEPISAERSRRGKLWGLGTGNITPTAGGERSVLWFKNNGTKNNWFIQKLIFGWNGGSTNFNRTVFSLIYYNTGEPTANNTGITAAIENISLSGTDAAVTNQDFLGYKWDGVSTGMTVGTGGFAQIPNRLGQGNSSVAIDGEIILGPGNAMEFRVTPEETGLFSVSVVFYEVALGAERGTE